MKNLKIAFVAAAFAAFSMPAAAQMVNATEPIVLSVDGYVVTAAQDTLKGQVAARVVNNYVTTIMFKDAKGAKTKYTANDVVAYGQKRPKLLRDYNDLTSVDKNYLHYESIEHPTKAGKKVFAERLMNGSRIKIFDNPTGSESSTNVAGFKLKENESSYVVYKQGSKPFILRKRKYEDEFAALFGDCAAFMNYAKDKPELKKFNNIGAVVENYNKHCQ
ncbi:MAG: hypothetical protein ACO1OF_22570 [Adhaeribacter sp.]